MPEGIPVAMIAGGDQELAGLDVRLSEFVDQWRGWGPRWDWEGYDRLGRVSAFMSDEIVASDLGGRALVALLAVAVERLAAK